MARRVPNAKELAELIWKEADPQRRARMIDWYWAKVGDEHGVLLAHWWRQEYEWLVNRRQRKLDEMRSKPALGAFPSWRDRQEKR